MAILINDTAPRNQYTATSGQTVFTVSFEFFENADLKVYKNAALQTITTHYTVTGAGVTGGGSITLTSGATAGDIITIVRDIPVKRVTDFPTSGPFNISALNTELDKIVAMVQEREDDITRVVQLADTDTSTSLILPAAASRASKVLGFDATGNTITMQELGNYRGNWAAGTAYVLRDIVKDTSNASIYICVQAHTSSGSQPLSTNPNAASWALLIDGASAAAAASSASAAASSASAAASSASAASGSASSASTSASNASTSATNASNSASSASTSATNAANSASSASTSATNAANSATSASGSATTATTQASNASSSASAAAASASTATTQASNASTSASNAASSASAAATSASNAASSASSASTSATSAAAAQSAAESARDATLAAYDNFDDRYLGAKTSNPSLDNDGNALVAGALYFNSVAGEMRLWTGSVWVAAYVSGSGFLSTSGGTITGDLVVSASGSTNAVRITQTGAGNALVVEDSANPDATPFVVDASGNVGIGTSSPAFRLTAVGGATQISPGTSAQEGVRIQRATGVCSFTGINNDNNAFNAFSFATGASEAMRIDSSGNVGIGTSSPASKLSVSSASSVQMQATTGTIDFRIQSIDANAAAYSGTVSNHAYAFTTNNAERMRIDASGNVGIGTSSPVTRLDVAGGVIRNSIAAAGLLQVATESANSITYQVGSDGSALYVGTNSNHALRFTTNNAERMRIDTSGNVGIGTSSPGSALDVKGTLRLSGATSGYVGLAPAAAAGSTTYTLPAADGTSGQVLSTNGSGTLSWAGGTLKNVQVFTSSGTYTRTAGVTTAVVIAVGGGGGGKGSAAGLSGTNGGNGGTTSFGSHVSAAGGSGATTQQGGAGGTGGAGATIAIKGQAGGGGASSSSGPGLFAAGTGGGQGAGAGGVGAAGVAGVRGGGGGGQTSTSGTDLYSGGGGGQGETSIKYTTTVGATETVTIGAGGTASGGGAGGAGYIIVYEYS